MAPSAGNALVVRSLPPVVTHTSAVPRYSPKLASSPRIRSARAPPIATLPYTARAAIPASATERSVTARSSETTTISELLGTRSPTQRSTCAAPANRLGIASSAASARAMPPTIVSAGATSTAAVISASSAALAIDSFSGVPDASTSPRAERSLKIASVGRPGRRSSAGETDASSVASTPQPTAIRTVLGRSVSCVPIGNATVR